MNKSNDEFPDDLVEENDFSEDSMEENDFSEDFNEGMDDESVEDIDEIAGEESELLTEDHLIPSDEEPEEPAVKKKNITKYVYWAIGLVVFIGSVIIIYPVLFTPSDQSIIMEQQNNLIKNQDIQGGINTQGNLKKIPEDQINPPITKENPGNPPETPIPQPGTQQINIDAPIIKSEPLDTIEKKVDELHSSQMDKLELIYSTLMKMQDSRPPESENTNLIAALAEIEKLQDQIKQKDSDLVKAQSQIKDLKKKITLNGKQKNQSQAKGVEKNTQTQADKKATSDKFTTFISEWQLSGLSPMVAVFRNRNNEFLQIKKGEKYNGITIIEIDTVTGEVTTSAGKIYYKAG